MHNEVNKEVEKQFNEFFASLNGFKETEEVIITKAVTYYNALKSRINELDYKLSIELEPLRLQLFAMERQIAVKVEAKVRTFICEFQFQTAESMMHHERIPVSTQALYMLGKRNSVFERFDAFTKLFINFPEYVEQKKSIGAIMASQVLSNIVSGLKNESFLEGQEKLDEFRFSFNDCPDTSELVWDANKLFDKRYNSLASIPKLEVTKTVSTMLIEHSKYLGRLSYFNVYIVWFYTISHAELAGSMRSFSKFEGQSVSDNVKQLARAFLSKFVAYAKLDMMNGEFPIKDADTVVWSYHAYINKYWATVDPSAANVDYADWIDNKQEYVEPPLELSLWFLDYYIDKLKNIIRHAPRIPKGSPPLKVYRFYHAFEKEPKATDKYWYDKAFLSTTYDPGFPLNSFLNTLDKSPWYLESLRYDEITIEPEMPFLSINPSYHAFPAEREIVLMPKARLRMDSKQTSELTRFFVPEYEKEKVQKGPPYFVGEVYTTKAASYPVITENTHLVAHHKKMIYGKDEKSPSTLLNEEETTHEKQ